MYITKCNPIDDDQVQNITILPQKPSFYHENLINSRISKKDSFLSERPGLDRNGDEHEYSETFREMMNKVLNRICKKNNFLRIKKKQDFLSLKSHQSPKQSDSQIYQSLTLEKKLKKTVSGLSKLNIKGIGRTENESNLLKKNPKPRVYNKTSISFIKNKEFRKSIDLQKAKSLPSYAKIQNPSEREKQNESILSNLERITFNNSFYPKVNEIKNLFDQVCKVDVCVPKFQARENYQKMQEVFKKELEPKHKKIELAKKLFHKKMAERQRNNQKQFHTSIQKPKIQIKVCQKDEHKNDFEPWKTNQEYFVEDMVKASKRFPS